MSGFDAVDLFAGPGGWDEGARMVGLSVVGLEWDHDACRTAVAAGHPRIRADVSQYPPEAFAGKVRGLIASPPCTAFSQAGQGRGREEIDRLHHHVERCRHGWVSPDGAWMDKTSPLVLEPLRWAWALRDDLDWVACEQVPPVLELWKHMADVLRGWGFDADARKLSSEQYGVPQTRTRAILLAHRDGVAWPKPTHQKYRPGEPAGAGEECRPSLFGPGLKPWVSMAEALGWGFTESPCNTVRGWSEKAGGVDPLTGGSGARRKRLNAIDDGTFLVRDSFGKPAEDYEGRAASRQKDASAQPSPTINSKTRDWTVERPATSVVGSFRPDVIAAPGYRTEVSRQDAPGSVVVEVHEAAILQSFAADYPWQGSRTKQFQQVGNAVPPLLAAHVLAALTGCANIRESEAA